MAYYVDLSRISLDDFKQRLQTTNLIPSVQILLDEIDARFALLQRQGIATLADVQLALKSKANVARLAAEISDLSLDYLTVLRREVNSYHPNTRKLADFACLADTTPEKLAAAGIKTTQTLYDHILTPADRAQLTEQHALRAGEARLLAKLADVSRLRYVNPAFATLLAYSQFDTVAKIRQVQACDLYAELSAVNAAGGYFSGALSERDMQYLIDNAAWIDLDIEYN